MNKNRKALHFDLSTRKLKKYYSDKNYRKAYKDIELFLKKYGFTHIQGSGYESKSELSRYEISKIVLELSKKLPWLKNCVKALTVTAIDENQHSMMKLIQNSDIRIKVKPERINKKIERYDDSKPGKGSLLSKLKDKQNEVNKLNTNKKLVLNRSKDNDNIEK